MIKNPCYQGLLHQEYWLQGSALLFLSIITMVSTTQTIKQICFILLCLCFMLNMIFLVAINIFYQNIRRAERRVRKYDEIKRVNRNLFIRMHEYPIIFFFSSADIILSFLEQIFYELGLLRDQRSIILCYYPLCEITFYGLEQSLNRS